MSTPAAIILDCEGETLSAEEKRLFAEVNPYGFILFARNCNTPAQVRALTQEIRDTVGWNTPILIDQEGGRVARLKPPHWRACPSAGSLASLPNASEAIYLNARLIAAELLGLGITVDCAPVADLPVPGAHDIIGDRAYGDTVQQVSELAARAADGLMEGGVMPVVKHIPGHGRAKADSHYALPVVDTPLEELRKTDFLTFRALHDLPMAMTAHVVYSAIDDKPATVSSAVIQVIREEIGFDGLLMSDELTMKALTGSLESRVTGALQAGCDVVMFCNGITTLSLEEKRNVAAYAGPMTEKATQRHQRAFESIEDKKRYAAPLDMAQAEAALTALLTRAA